MNWIVTMIDGTVQEFDADYWWPTVTEENMTVWNLAGESILFPIGTVAHVSLHNPTAPQVDWKARLDGLARDMDDIIEAAHTMSLNDGEAALCKFFRNTFAELIARHTKEGEPQQG